MSSLELFIEKFYKDFQEYTYKNKVLVAASGFVIGIATNNFVGSIMKDVIEPSLDAVFKNVMLLSPIPNKNPILWKFLSLVIQILWIIIVWIVTIFLSFFVIEYILNRKIIGLTSKVTDSEKQQFIKEKIESKSSNNILPNKTDEKEIAYEKAILEQMTTQQK